MTTTQKNELISYIMYPADNAMILGQRLGEWCGHGPVLEQDIALTNIALDLIGEARNFYQYAAELSGGGISEDYFPYQRDVRQFNNVLLVELPNGHWGDTLMRQFMFDCYHYFYLNSLKSSADERLAAIASKSFKEVSYHLKFSSEWIIRLGDGTEESHHKMQTSLDNLLPYFDELFIPTDLEKQMAEQGIAPEPEAIARDAHSKFESIITQSTLRLPSDVFAHKGGKAGLHTEHMGYILAELQYMQKSYPGCEW